MKRPIVLIDSDGVLSDFQGAFLREVECLVGVAPGTYTPEHVTNFKIHECAFFVEAARSRPHLKQDVENVVTTVHGWCRGLEPIPGASVAVRRLQELAEVYCVTSPWHSSPFWHHERTEWLHEHMGIAANRVVHASDKRIVAGDVLVDDKPENLSEWRHGLGMLWNATYNRDAVLTRGHVRAFGWGDVIAAVEQIAGRAA